MINSKACLSVADVMTDHDYGGGSVVSGSPSKSKSILLSLFNTNGPKVLLSRHAPILNL
jgi:hypothetical protein